MTMEGLSQRELMERIFIQVAQSRNSVKKSYCYYWQLFYSVLNIFLPLPDLFIQNIWIQRGIEEVENQE